MLPASCLSAWTSFGKQRAAIADARAQELRADALVEAHPARDLVTSAPSSSDTFAISLMKEIFVARKAFEASLIISALATSVRTIGAPSGA